MKMNVLKPSYYDKFSCLGSECKYNCCHGWRIDVSKEEYNRIINIEKSKELAQLTNGIFEKIGKGGSYKKYSIMKLNENEYCGYFNKDGLCALQLECGYECLPVICKTFPRHINKYMNNIERHLTLGCEKVVQLLIECKEGIELINTEENLPSNISTSHFIGEIDVKRRPILKYYYDIKIFILAILQNRNYSMNERMFLMGMGIEKLDVIEKEKMVNETNHCMKQFLTNLEDTELHNSINSIKKQPTIQVLNALFTVHKMEKGDKALSTIMEKITENLEIEKVSSNMKIDNIKGEKIHLGVDTTFQFDNKKYELAKQRYEIFMKDKEHIMENIMISYFLFTDQPFQKIKRKLWENYMYFTVCYNLLKFVIMGYLSEEPNEDELIYCVTVLSRKLTHNPAIFNFTVDMLIKTQSATLAHMALLVL